MPTSSPGCRALPRAVFVVAAALATSAWADMIEADVHRISSQGVHEQLGTAVAVQRDGSLEIRLRLHPLPPGWHAMHVHENPDCGPAMQDGVPVAGGAAGGHFDPTGAMKSMTLRRGPDDGKARKLRDAERQPRKPRPLGDLPAVFTNEGGRTDARILSYRLDIAQLRGRSLILHAYPETTDDPRLPSGGGQKIACAVFPD